MKIEYIEKKSLLYKSKVEFEDYAVNHITNCVHNCKYPCFARLIAQKSEKEWTETIKISSNHVEVIKRELRSITGINQVHLCFMSDCFMYQVPEVSKATLEILEVLHDSKVKYKTLTKGEMPSSEIIRIEHTRNPTDLFSELDSTAYPINEYGISLVSLSESYRKKYEPETAPFEKRIKALQSLSEAGLYTYIYCEPFAPLLTSQRDFRALLDSVSFVKKIYFGSWQYNDEYQSKPEYKPYIKLIQDFTARNNISLMLKKELKFIG